MIYALVILAFCLVLAALRFFGVITWDWWWVFSPLWLIPLGGAAALLLGMIAVAGVSVFAVWGFPLVIGLVAGAVFTQLANGETCPKPSSASED